jgi:hypothetical protein
VQNTKLAYLVANNNVTIILVASILILSGVMLQLYPTYGQVPEPQPDGTGSVYATAIIAVAGVVLAIIGIVKEVMKSRLLEGKISEKTKEQIDLAETVMTKLLQKSEVMKQFADTAFYQLFPEKAKEIGEANAIQVKNLNETLAKDITALNELRELIAKFQAGEVSEERAGKLAKDIVARSETKIFTQNKDQAYDITAPETVKRKFSSQQ